MNTRGTWVDHEGVLQAAPAPRFSDAPDWQPAASPDRGQHSADILAELGLNKD